MYKISFRVNIVVCLLFLYSHAEVAHKRLPMGFQGMRGKKSINLASLDDVQEGENPLSIARFQSYLLSQQPDHYYPYKRAPMGFMGMRGKKDDLYDGYLSPEENVFDFEEKRGLKGFQGMRGKKQIEYPILSYPNKRKQMGFQGMRGKKDNVDDIFNTFDTQAKNGEINDFLSNYGSPYFTDLGYSGEDYEKRGGLRGFQGMRGKREFDFDGLEQLKRAPSGFQGMRGKRDNEENKSDNSVENSPRDIGMKEVVGTTILPTSNIGEQLSGLESFGNGDLTTNLMGMHLVKRSPNYGFFGMRGKKMPSLSSYFGTRGKKGPFDFSFRGKFVGVRGKKSEAYQQYNDDRVSLFEEYQNRRGPDGFVGIRDKRSAATDGPLHPVDKTGNQE